MGYTCTGHIGYTATPASKACKARLGEVKNAQLTTAINGTSSNTNNVSTLGLTVSDPPTQSEVHALANKLDELINALRR